MKACSPHGLSTYPFDWYNLSNIKFPEFFDGKQ
jgi:hypothetical protein